MGCHEHSSIPHPPRSIVRLARAGGKGSLWNSQLGREFRIGYYNPKDGLDCIWLVNERGEYEQSTDCASLLRHFEIVRLSDETDYFGKSRPALGGLRQRRPNKANTAPKSSRSRLAVPSRIAG